MSWQFWYQVTSLPAETSNDAMSEQLLGAFEAVWGGAPVRCSPEILFQWLAYCGDLNVHGNMYS